MSTTPTITTCRRCGRVLKKPSCVRAGIGPVCAAKEGIAVADQQTELFPEPKMIIGDMTIVNPSEEDYEYFMDSASEVQASGGDNDAMVAAMSMRSDQPEAITKEARRLKELAKYKDAEAKQMSMRSDQLAATVVRRTPETNIDAYVNSLHVRMESMDRHQLNDSFFELVDAVMPPGYSIQNDAESHEALELILRLFATFDGSGFKLSGGSLKAAYTELINSGILVRLEDMD